MIQQSINRYKRGAKVKKDLRLLMFEKCNRNCEGCCNKDFDLKNLPVETQFGQYDLIMLTGGEPMLDPALIIHTITEIRLQGAAKIILYTAKIDEPEVIRVVFRLLDGITVTLHDQSDVKPFMKLSEILMWYIKPSLELNASFGWSSSKDTKSMRVNIFKGVEIPQIHTYWKVKRDIEWIENCPLPKNEVFKRL